MVWYVCRMVVMNSYNSFNNKILNTIPSFVRGVAWRGVCLVGFCNAGRMAGMHGMLARSQPILRVIFKTTMPARALYYCRVNISQVQYYRFF